MTKRQKEIVLDALKGMADQLQPEELPDWLLMRGKALPFYRKASEAHDADTAFLALYNAYGSLMGFRPGAQAMADDMNCAPRRVRAVLARIRRDEGDAERSEMHVEAPSAAELEALKHGFRIRFLKL